MQTGAAGCKAGQQKSGGEITMPGEDIHKGHRNRMRKRFEQDGLERFEPHQVLELLLFYAIPQRDTNKIAHRLLERFGSISRVFDASIADLASVEEIGYNTAVLLKMVPQLAKIYQKDRWQKRVDLSLPATRGEFVKSLFIGEVYEVLYLVCLDSAKRLLACVRVHEGTLDEISMYPRNVVEAALRQKARYLIMAHNHPSGNKMPSNGDIFATEKVAHALKAVGIDLLDHVVVGAEEYSSFQEMGIMNSWNI